MSSHGRYLGSSDHDSFDFDLTGSKLEAAMMTRQSCSRSRKMRRPCRAGQCDCSNKQLCMPMRTMVILDRAPQCTEKFRAPPVSLSHETTIPGLHKAFRAAMEYCSAILCVDRQLISTVSVW